MNEGRDGDGLGVGLWGCLRYGGMYGVSHRRSIFGVWVREFSGDACRRLCPLTGDHQNDLQQFELMAEEWKVLKQLCDILEVTLSICGLLI